MALSDTRSPLSCPAPIYQESHCLADSHVKTAWTVDAAVLPEVPTTGRYFGEPKICRQALDNGFEGWCGEAVIYRNNGARSLALSSPDAMRFQVYSPREGRYFVAEPVQHTNAALNGPQQNWRALGLHLLEPGQTRSLHARSAVRLK